MKKILIFTICLTLLLASLSTAFATNFNGASDWAISELESANEDGFITQKIAENMTTDITREEFCEIAVILYDKIGGKQDLKDDNPFTDTVNPNVIKAYNAGIIMGVSNDLFAPDNNLTREQLCVMLIRAMKSAGIIFENDSAYSFQKTYQDENDISTWAYIHVLIMNDFKIMNGYGDNLNPGSSITREQAVIMLERTYLREFEIVDNVLTSYLGNSSDVSIPNGVISVGENVFHSNLFVKTVTMPQSIVDIGYYSFTMMDNLENIYLNEGLKTIGEASFELCESLNNVILPDSLETISFMAFQDCLTFTEITIPSAVNYIDDQAFYRCENLNTVTFEGDVEYIGESAFDECDNVTFVCESGSNVESYALEHEIEVIYK